ncbi:furin-like protein protease 1 [Dermatophagoides farinae]|uniref:furin n=1 Tax=Dermatophagoides farinae TaxID=6954 RepID=A0A9D4P547_DERFA|nr:furin-like protein protease 1 [Dermatophagoides farinae]
MICAFVHYRILYCHCLSIHHNNSNVNINNLPNSPNQRSQSTLLDDINERYDHDPSLLHQNNHHHRSKRLFSDQFVVRIHGGDEFARQLANDHDFTYLGHIIDDYYHLMHRKVAKRSAELYPSDNNNHEPTSSFHHHPSVLSIEQQPLNHRTKRDFISNTHLNLNTAHSVSNSHRLDVVPYYMRPPLPAQPPCENNLPLLPFPFDHNEFVQGGKRVRFDDPQWPRMWYLNRGNNLDMDVVEAWEKNITGKGVVVTILDDGLEKDHPDLVTNYDPDASYDVNGFDNDPMPRYDIIDSNRHGTRCAGEVAANANNSVCAVGVAFDAKVGGIRMLDGDVTDAVEARSLGYNPQHIHIYSASWGPDDDGRTVDGPGKMAVKAFENGIRNGRNGKGSIFVWASGNGGREKDNCNCDGYTNSIWTLSISSATEKGSIPWYSEACSATLASTYSSGSFGERQIVTTDLHHGCTSSHTGTSASAPLAAGICALALEANNNLTWRDMQHIVVLSAKRKNLEGNWMENGVGLNVSHWFGYGLINASAMVDYAREWVPVPEQTKCIFKGKVNELSKAKNTLSYALNVTCNELMYMEHVQVVVNLTTPKRGDIEIEIRSPAGTRSTLLTKRPKDNSVLGFSNWPFMTVHFWGESPNGQWTLYINSTGRHNNTLLHGWKLIMHGTREFPFGKSYYPKRSKPQLLLNDKKTVINDFANNQIDMHPSPSRYANRMINNNGSGGPINRFTFFNNNNNNNGRIYNHSRTFNNGRLTIIGEPDRGGGGGVVDHKQQNERQQIPFIPKQIQSNPHSLRGQSSSVSSELDNLYIHTIHKFNLT